MNRNPDTLEEETAEERLKRQAVTGVVGNGLSVICFPIPDEPLVQEVRSRAACLTQPLPMCSRCRHSVFTLVFDTNTAEARYNMVACPRWSSPTGRGDKKDPDFYVPVELAACEKRQLDFCPSCPSQEDLVQIYSADKRKEGWYSRYARLRAKEFENNE